MENTIAPHLSFITGFYGFEQPYFLPPTVVSSINVDRKRVQLFPLLTIEVCGICYGSESVQNLIANRDGWTLAFAGKIYNLLELRNRLAKHGLARSVFTEADIFLFLYLHDKEWLLQNINAKFCAVIAHDSTIILLRDKVGEEQVYYGISDKNIAFSTEIKAVAHLLGNTAISVTESFKLFETPFGNETMHRGIHKLEAGTELKINLITKKTTIHTYWQILPQTKAVQTEKMYVEEFLHLINDAIYLRLPQEKPVSAYLSGGQDSSFICCTLDKMEHKPETVYTTAWNNLDSVYNEAPWASIVAEIIDVPHVVLEPDATAFQQHYPLTLWILDEVKANAAHFIEYWIAKEAFARGDTCLFSGYGSDEILGGEIRYLVMYLDRDRKKSLPLFDTHSLLKSYKPLMEKLCQLPSHLSEAEKYFYLIKRGNASATAELFYQKLLQDIFGQFPTLIDQMGYADILISSPPLLDSARLNKFWGIDKICPFLDYRVIEFAFSLPEKLKINGLTTKNILRLASKDIVPDPITYRPDKVGFAFPHNDQQYVGFLYKLVDALRLRLDENISIQVDKTRGRYDRTMLMLASQEILHQFYTDKDFTLINGAF
jgi:asparagine synthase (glutamine-hydrolysing)